MGKKTLVCVNALTEIDNAVYNSHNQMWYRMGRDFPNDKFINYTPARTTIDNARNFAAKLAMQEDCDYVFFVDDDMILHEKTFTSLRENIERPGVDIVMALTYVRGYPFHPMFFKDKKDGDSIDSLDFYDDFQKDIDDKHTVRCDAIGCACVLIKVDLIKQLEAPYFVTTPFATEDVYFCLKAARTLGRKNVGIYVDCGVPTGHLGEKVVYTHENIAMHKKWLEEAHPSLLQDKSGEGDRGVQYLQRIGEPIPDPKGTLVEDVA